MSKVAANSDFITSECDECGVRYTERNGAKLTPLFAHIASQTMAQYNTVSYIHCIFSYENDTAMVTENVAFENGLY